MRVVCTCAPARLPRRRHGAQEEVKDLLLPNHPGNRPAVSIRETPSGGVCLYGAVEKDVATREDMAAVLEMGTLCRSTASTNMNNRSSRWARE